MEQRYGRLQVISNRIKHGERWVECLCDCGKEKSIRMRSLLAGTKSCGCLVGETARKLKPARTHGMVGTREYRCWERMTARCKYEYDTNNWKVYYGDKEVYPEWIGRGGFQRFLDEIGSQPRDGQKYEVDRIHNDGHYVPGNVRWLTHKENCRNKRNNIRLYGRLLIEWAEEAGTNYQTAWARYKRGHRDLETILYPGDLREKRYVNEERMAA